MEFFKKVGVILFLTFALFNINTLSSSAQTTEQTDENDPLNSSIGGYVDGWRIGTSSYIGLTYGAWNDCALARTSGYLECSKTIEVSNTFSGSLEVSKSDVSATVGFDVSKSWSTTASYGDDVPARTKIQYRNVYNNYKVSQYLVRTYLITGTKETIDTKYVYPKKFSGFEFRKISY